jgi:activator of 2-hydroxyglutaryl-CoA dehydratase
MESMKLRFSDGKLHHVAAKCGVFAETDIVNLVKASIPAEEIMCSLADAIVMQNLSVLTRGNTLRHRVLLLGGPNAYLPFLQDCWRKRIPETWASRGDDYPKDRPIEDLIFVPPRAEYYAAFGAVMYGAQEPSQLGTFRGLEALRTFSRRAARPSLATLLAPRWPAPRSNWKISASSTAFRASSPPRSRLARRCAW